MSSVNQTLHTDYDDRIYANAGNPDVVAMINTDALTVLDVGCGAGDNAALLKARNERTEIYGITASKSEAELALRWMTQCHVADLEGELPSAISERHYDAIVCSHVLEHLRNPATLVMRLSALLKPGGSLVIAVPNVMFWRERARFLAGRFEYAPHGTMDETHLRFFTYYTAADYLLAGAKTLTLVETRAPGGVPLWLLRRKLLSKRLAQAIDQIGIKLVPNLFGEQVLLKAVRRE